MTDELEASGVVAGRGSRVVAGDLRSGAVGDVMPLPEAILSAEHIEDFRFKAAQSDRERMQIGRRGYTVLLDSHEALRAQVVALTEERDAARRERNALQSETARHNAIDYDLNERWQDGEGRLRTRVAALEAGLCDAVEWWLTCTAHVSPGWIDRARALLEGTEPAAKEER